MQNFWAWDWKYRGISGKCSFCLWLLDPSGGTKGIQIYQLPEMCTICAGWTMPGQYICLVFWVLFGFIFIFYFGVILHPPL